ncbi:MAG: GNAT family N-acetyltransferase [Chloroflexota bacterium]|nr:GNAT family N-acetyltransferase [Anaerolineales bacterium]MCA9978095.1 GNAT family N-acetyltransferase [Anaerolineales bacterium]MCB8967869.1 GNAT family N-acetyltransferase [Ardenticatenaceae bacterium]
MELISADNYTFEELTEAYNQTRVDYLVPMPMNVARLREYIHTYDVQLPHSFVVAKNGEILGLGMLGVRENRSWVTRLGVLPSGRRQGIGQIIMDALIQRSEELGIQAIWLEVIKGNKPAHILFQKCDFTETRELLVARRPPNPNAVIDLGNEVKRVTFLDHEDAIILLSHRQERPNWLNETESMQNVRNLSALLVELNNGGRGWVTYHAGLLQLTRIVVEVTVGDPAEVAGTVLKVMHQRHKRQDAIAENIPVTDPKWAGFEAIGYFDSFRRIEMIRPYQQDT